MKRQLQRQAEPVLSSVYLYVQNGVIVCDYLTISKLDVDLVEACIDDADLAAKLESPKAEYFESESYQGVRVWLVPKASQNSTDIIKQLSVFSESLIVRVVESDGYEVWFTTNVFEDAPPYMTV
ncbi:hypothetical protein LJC04_06925 [Ruminococcaceae bacterium OttesenSCG-928-O06]|nr:hypothetical protein [Ruminococcaceae bacterium OttesenSCG-928-O06]